MKRHKWTFLTLEHTFSTADGTAAYDELQSDHDRFIDNTLWNRSTYKTVRGPLNARSWQIAASGLQADPSIWSRIRLKPVSGANQLYISPTPSAVETVVFEYVSDKWAKSSGGTLQTEFAADADTALFDEYLMELDVTWRIKRTMGLSYGDEKFEFVDRLNQAIAADLATPTLSLNAGDHHFFELPAITQEIGFG